MVSRSLSAADYHRHVLRRPAEPGSCCNWHNNNGTHAGMCIIKANVSALYTTTVFALLVWLRFNWAADDFFNPRLIYATIGLNPIFIEVNAFRTSPYPNTATFYNRGECFCKRIDLLRCRGSNVVGLCVFIVLSYMSIKLITHASFIVKTSPS